MARVKNVTAEILNAPILPSKVLMPICMRSPAVHGRNLTASLEAFVRQGGRKMTVLLCDALDRHNMPQSVDSWAQSLQDGKDWLTQNKPVLDTYAGNYDVITWADDILTHPAFERMQKIVNDMYKNRPEIHAFIESLVDYYFGSQVAKFNELTRKGIYAATPRADIEKPRSRAYLLEEMAGDMIVAKLFPETPRIYWGLWISNPQIFNEAAQETGLTLPETLPIAVSRLHAPVASGDLLSRYLMVA